MTPTDPYKRYRPWFLAATVYNTVWGIFVVLFPTFFFDLFGMAPMAYPSLFQCIGMFVLVYALGYWYLYRDPERYANLIWIGLIGKTLGPVGFLYAFMNQDLPLSFGLINLFNDVIWWPAFWSFALKHARKPLE